MRTAGLVIVLAIGVGFVAEDARAPYGEARAETIWQPIYILPPHDTEPPRYARSLTHGAAPAPIIKAADTKPTLASRIMADAEVACQLVDEIAEHTGNEAQAYSIAMAVARSARNHGLAPELVCALIQQESAFRPRAVSRTNDHGLMQLHGKRIYDIEDSIEAGCLHLAGCQGSTRERLAHYNGGTRPPGSSYAYADRVIWRAEEWRQVRVANAGRSAPVQELAVEQEGKP